MGKGAREPVPKTLSWGRLEQILIQLIDILWVPKSPVFSALTTSVEIEAKSSPITKVVTANETITPGLVLIISSRAVRLAERTARTKSRISQITRSAKSSARVLMLWSDTVCTEPHNRNMQ